MSKAIPVKYDTLAKEILTALNADRKARETFDSAYAFSSACVAPVKRVVKKVLEGKRYPKPVFRNGAYRVAVIFPKVVLKFALCSEADDRMPKEHKLVTRLKAHRRYGRHFLEMRIHRKPRSRWWKNVLIMERVKIPKGSYNSYDPFESEVVRLGEWLGLDDMHNHNWSWKGEKGKEYPVFIDCELARSDMTVGEIPKRRSWMV